MGSTRGGLARPMSSVIRYSLPNWSEVMRRPLASTARHTHEPWVWGTLYTNSTLKPDGTLIGIPGVGAAGARMALIRRGKPRIITHTETGLAPTHNRGAVGLAQKCGVALTSQIAGNQLPGSGFPPST